MADWLQASTDRAVAKVENIARARKIGQMLVTGAEEGTVEDLPLLDVARQNPKEMLASFDAERARYQTAPFDPEGSRLKFYPGGVTIWSGYPGAGKTTLLRQLACHVLHREGTVFFASLEEHPRDLIIRLAATAAGMEHPDEEKLSWFCDYYGDRIKVWGVIGMAQHRKLLGAIKATKCQHAIIDSLMCLDIDNGDYERQRQFANAIAATARTTQTHIHLVAHPRKVIDSNQEPDISDVAGAREIAGIADNVLFVRRSKKENFGDSALGMLVTICKNRHDGNHGNIDGWYQRQWRQFSQWQFPEHPIRYLPNEAY
jgi:twinkle protein